MVSDTGTTSTTEEQPKQLRLSKRMEIAMEQVIFKSRWFLLPFYFGLFATLIIFSIHFVLQVTSFGVDIWDMGPNEALIVVLTMIDKVLVAGLVIMVLIGGYENSVSRLDISEEDRKLSWLGKLDASSLKLKLSTAIVSISSIHLLRVFLDMPNHESVDTEEVMWTLIVHFVMVLTALILTFVDKLSYRRGGMDDTAHG